MERIALNYDQVTEYSPVPNFTKLTDSRASDYIKEYGNSSWELDALEPSVISSLVESSVESFKDSRLWAEKIEEEDQGRHRLEELLS